jgi:hypothetical protein
VWVVSTPPQEPSPGQEGGDTRPAEQGRDEEPVRESEAPQGDPLALDQAFADAAAFEDVFPDGVPAPDFAAVFVSAPVEEFDESLPGPEGLGPTDLPAV